MAGVIYLVNVSVIPAMEGQTVTRTLMCVVTSSHASTVLPAPMLVLMSTTAPVSLATLEPTVRLISTSVTLSPVWMEQLVLWASPSPSQTGAIICCVHLITGPGWWLQLPVCTRMDRRHLQWKHRWMWSQSLSEWRKLHCEDTKHSILSHTHYKYFHHCILAGPHWWIPV